MLFTSTRYPADHGFIEDTLADDNPMDALVFWMSQPSQDA
jgi:inorganic pyrophosphatase